MTTNRLLAFALMAKSEPSIKLDPSLTRATTESERALAIIIAEETEKLREARRSETGGNTKVGLLQEVDYVDTLHWDELLRDIDVVKRCSVRSNLTSAEVLRFAYEKCIPSNWSALFWMSAWYEQISKSVTVDVAEVARGLEARYKEKEAEDMRRRVAPAATKRRQNGLETSQKIRQLAEPMRGKKSKEGAAIVIADQLSLSPATIRKKLITLYPGKTWALLEK